MRFLAALLGLAAVVLGLVVAIHDLGLEHTSRTIEAFGLGPVVAGAGVVALAAESWTGRRRP